MKLSDLQNANILRNLYEQNTTLSLFGPPGIGKSAFFRTIPDTLSRFYSEPFGYMEVLVPTLDAPDVRGFLVPTKRGDQSVAEYTYPAILPSKEYLEAHPRGVLVLDEFGQAEPLTAKALAPLILEKTVGEFKLPPGWWVVVASNRTTDRSGVNRMMMHIVNRWRQIEVETDIEGWCNWAAENRLPPIGISFVRARPGQVFADVVPAEPVPFCSPRSYTSAMQYLGRMSEDGMNVPSDPVTMEMVQGSIGVSKATEFFAYARCVEFLPTIEEILKNPTKAKVPTIERMDACYAAQQLCEFHFDEKNIAQIWTYLLRMPREMQVSSVRRLVMKNMSLMLNYAPLKTFIEKNGQLLRASVRSE